MTHSPSVSWPEEDLKFVSRRTGTTSASGGAALPLHILLTVNAAWNAWNFRKALLRELIAEGHTVTVLAPPDESMPRLVEMGCRVMPLAMSPSE